MTMLSIVRCALIGALISGALTSAGFLIFAYDVILGPHDTDERQAWAQFAMVMTSVGASVAGFGIGAIYGVIRKFRARKRLREPD